jgi:hypothetical protein
VPKWNINAKNTHKNRKLGGSNHFGMVQIGTLKTASMQKEKR